MKKLNLDELEKAQHTVSLRGQEYRVSPMTPRVAILLDAASTTESTTAKLTGYVDAACLIVPTMRREDVEGLSLTQILAIITLSRTEADAVDTAVADPNGASPAPKKATGRTKTATV